MKSNSHFLCTLAVLAALTATAQAQHLFHESFSNLNAAGWTLDPEWQIGPCQVSSGQNFGIGDPTYDAAQFGAQNIAGAVIGGNPSNATVHGYRWITSPVINAQGFYGVYLSYARWLNSASLPQSNNRVQVYDGQTWQTIWESGFVYFTDGVWNQEFFDISTYANANMRVRFGFDVEQTGGTVSSGWNLDEIAVTYYLGPLRNAGFENLEFDFVGNRFGIAAGNSTEIAPWTVNADVTSVPANVAQSYDGSHAIGLNSATTGVPGQIEQTIHAQANHTYLVTYEMAADVGAASTQTVEVSAAFAGFTGVQSQSYAHQIYVPNPTQQNPGWTKQYWVFNTIGGALSDFGAALRFTSLASGIRGPLIDHVEVRDFGGNGQANSIAAELDVDYFYTLGLPGPFAHAISVGTPLQFDWTGPAGQPMILAASLTNTHHTVIGGLGIIDIGTAPSFQDVFIIADGTNSVQSLFFTLSPFGSASQSFTTYGIPAGTEIAFQGVVLQPIGSPTAYALTASHTVVFY